MQTAAASTVSPVTRARNIPHLVTLQLYAASAGFCQFRGCSRHLLKHPVTKDEDNFAVRAHIYAFSKEGPRGDDAGRPEDIHDFTNLMLLCGDCHTLIDGQPARYSVATLKNFKREHEGRILRAALLTPDCETVVVVVTAPIRGAHVAVPRDDVLAAISPFYPAQAQFCTVDLSDLDGETEGASFNEVACRKIDREMAKLFAGNGPVASTPRISLFAIAPMPILAHLGARLDNKIALQLYQRHRDTQNWSWKADATRVGFTTRVMKERPRGAPVAIVLSLSGTIAHNDLPAVVRSEFAIYEMTLDGVVPSPTFLNHPETLGAFAMAYHDLLGQIAADHGYVDAIDVFPAAPAPIAVLLGRERLMKRHPALRIFDADKENGGFCFQVEIK
ncbi:MAG: SAVED domain-containing protein [Vitreimonas sp.]